ncbi:MAG: hypothetical protein M3R24_21935 [Chloroflexota bacterium]|nr:hypothetical protein [Chloroflexota bacterium]
MLALLALAAPTASAQRQTTTSTAAAACTPNPEADLSGSLSADGMSGTVRNTSATCAYQVGIAAYRMFDNVIDNQELYDHKVATIAPGATIRFSVSLPNCKVQVDLFYGNVLLSLKGQRYGDRLLSAKIMGTTYCTRDAGCTLTQGYWKNHVKAWPVTSLTLGTRIYSQRQLLTILKTPVKGNGLISLAHQLIAAKLNVAKGADNTAIRQVIADADALIGNLDVGGGGYLAPSATSSLTGKLDAYNNGLAGPGHCG